ncbi:hypothetical protein KEM48_008990 [Puccinia striiformis f. sp. tritici PST-130]|nr:hypothetical protein KEM48_008990 [Puccinia striiformis f. sp. tritici PST-130]
MLGWQSEPVGPSPGWQADSDRVPHRDPSINLLIDPLFIRIPLQIILHCFRLFSFLLLSSAQTIPVSL